MRGTYVLPGTNMTLANQAVSLLFINPGVDATLEILRCWCSQAANATSAQQRVQLNTQVTAFPTLVTIDPEPTAPIDQASTIVGGTAGAAGTSGKNASAEGAGAKTIIQPDAFNVLNGWLWVATPAPLVAEHTTMAHLPSPAPASTTTRPFLVAASKTTAL